jgi:hypothetical protein
MNQLEIANLLKSLPWKTSVLRGENHLVRWLPIIDVSGKNFFANPTITLFSDFLVKLFGFGYFFDSNHNGVVLCT